MQLNISLVLSIAPVVLGQMAVEKYNCATDGLPTIIINAGQAPSSPVIEFFVPLFTNCSDADNRKPAQLSPGPILGGSLGNVPTAASSLIVSGIADQDGFTGTEAALRLAQFFPLELARCVVTLSGGVIKQFNSTATTMMSGDGAAISIVNIFCGR